MNNYIPQYDTELFKNIYEDMNTFLADWKASDIYSLTTETSPIVSDNGIKLTYCLLYAKYANNPIINWDTNQFKAKLWQIIFQYGPTWEKELEIQKELRGLTEADLREGATAIYNHAYNPNNAPTTQTTTELSYINEQNVTKNKKSKLQAYAVLDELIKKDVSALYINQFSKLFNVMVRPERMVRYYSED